VDPLYCNDQQRTALDKASRDLSDVLEKLRQLVYGNPYTGPNATDINHRAKTVQYFIKELLRVYSKKTKQQENPATLILTNDSG